MSTGSHPCFSAGHLVFFPPQNKQHFKFQFDLQTVDKKSRLVEFPSLNLNLFLFYVTHVYSKVQSPATNHQSDRSTTDHHRQDCAQPHSHMCTVCCAEYFLCHQCRSLVWSGPGMALPKPDSRFLKMIWNLRWSGHICSLFWVFPDNNGILQQIYIIRPFLFSRLKIINACGLKKETLRNFRLFFFRMNLNNSISLHGI